MRSSKAFILSKPTAQLLDHSLEKPFYLPGLFAILSLGKGVVGL
jgi:hypothetical protein